MSGMPIIPHRFLFRFSIPVSHVAKRATGGQPFLDLDAAPFFPDLNPLDDATSFAKLQAGWNEDGIGFRVTVAGKKMPIAEIPDEPRESDGFQLWLDTRNTQSIHRASRFCHHFAFLPASNASAGLGKKNGAGIAYQFAIALAKEDASSNRAGLLRTASKSQVGGYVLDAWIPTETLTGYDPTANPLIGFYYVVRDAELGEQFLAVGRDFPFDHDPSLWSTLELTP
jgi:Carbohydrate family 9 binding domain-like